MHQTEKKKEATTKNRPCFLRVSCLVCFCVVSAGLPGEECQPSESRGGQAEGQVSRPGPEARRPRPPHEAATERGRLPLKTENTSLPANPSTTSCSSVMIHLDWSKTAKLNSVPLYTLIFLVLFFGNLMHLFLETWPHKRPHYGTDLHYLRLVDAT